MTAIHFDDDVTVRVGDAAFYYGFPLPEELPRSVLPLLKPRTLIDRTVELVTSEQPATIVEFGIHRGGSTAFLAALAEPERLVAIELDEPAAPLTAFIESRDLDDVIRPHYGVDQGDRRTVAAIIDREFASRPIDLVIDDASHLYWPTLASFETLYPRLRPGGTYVIEDWAGDHHIAHRMAVDIERSGADAEIERIANSVDAQVDSTTRDSGLVDAFRADPVARISDVCRAVIESQDRVPLSRLALELTLAQAEMPGFYESVTITDGWVRVTRGDAEIDPSTFRVTSTWRDYYQLLDSRIRPRERSETELRPEPD